MQVSKAVQIVSFQVCSCLLIWKTHDCIAQYLDLKVGSSIKFVPNVQDELLLTFAVCFHPDEILDHSEGRVVNGVRHKSIRTEHGLTKKDMRTMKPFRVMKSGHDYHHIYHHFVRNPSALVDLISFQKEGGDTPVEFPVDARATQVYFPEIGRCTVFYANYTVANNSNNLEGVTFFRAPGTREKMMLYVFEHGQFFKTFKSVHVDTDVGLVIHVDVQVEDRSEDPTAEDVQSLLAAFMHVPVKSISGNDCEERDHDSFHEDDCLFNCLEKRFIDKAGCIHPFMEKSDYIKRKFPRIKHCNKTDIEKLATRDPSDPLFGAEHLDLDPGHLLYTSIMLSFRRREAAYRCHCPVPCVRKTFKLNFWRELRDDLYKNWIVFKIAPNIITTEYYLQYSLTSMFAEIGGFIGLFLGFSLFSIVDVYIFVTNYLRKKKDKPAEEA